MFVASPMVIARALSKHQATSTNNFDRREANSNNICNTIQDVMFYRWRWPARGTSRSSRPSAIIRYTGGSGSGSSSGSGS
eukprot:16025616-Heterocapsa_arctica.AAC.1